MANGQSVFAEFSKLGSMKTLKIKSSVFIHNTTDLNFVVKFCNNG